MDAKERLEVLMKASVAPGPYMHGYGITLRQHYAGLAMQGLLANTDAEDVEAHKLGLFAGPLSENAVLFADALLAELAKETTP